jgi:hypothetical protein
VEHYENWIDKAWAIAPEKMILRLLSNRSPIEQKMKKKSYPRRLIRFWKHSKDFSSSLWVTGDYVTIIMTRTRPHYLVEIHDVVLAHNTREIFKGLWKQTEE